jgi:hypothetical protein
MLSLAIVAKKKKSVMGKGRRLVLFPKILPKEHVEEKKSQTQKRATFFGN